MTKHNLYIGCNGYVLAIRVADGVELWRTKLSDSAFSSTGGEDVCLIEDEGRVLAGCAGHLFCLDAATGVHLWHNELKGLGHNEVTLAMAGKSVQFVSQHTHTHS